MTLSIALRGVAGRQLISGDWNRDLNDAYLVHSDVLMASTELNATSLIADPLTVGVVLTQQILRQFGLDVPDQLLIDWQAEVLRR